MDATRLVVTLVLVAVAVIVALVLQRRRPDAPTQPTTWTVPAQVDRADFPRADAPWLVVLFSSASCDTCAGMRDKVALLDSGEVATVEVEAVADKAVHDRYGIDAVPTLVIADAEGVVRASFVGPVSAADLWATVAEVREPGSVPPGCDHGVEGGGDPDHAHGHAPPQDPGLAAGPRRGSVEAES